MFFRNHYQNGYVTRVLDRALPAGCCQFDANGSPFVKHPLLRAATRLMKDRHSARATERLCL